MAIAFRSSSHAYGSGTVAVAVPAGVQAGDVLLAILSNTGGGAGNALAQTGWTQIGTQYAAGSLLSAAYYRIATATEATDYASGYNFASCNFAEIIVSAYSGVDNTTPINASAVWSAAAATTSSTIPSVTTSVAGCKIVALWTDADNNDTSLVTPTGWTKDANADGGTSAAVYEIDQATAGASPTATLSYASGYADSSQVMAVALAPATVAAPAQTISPTAIADASAINQPTLHIGSVTVSPSAIGSAGSVSQPVVTPGAASIAPHSIASVSTVGAITVTGGLRQHPNVAHGASGALITKGASRAVISSGKTSASLD